MPSLKKKSITGLFWDFSGKIGLQGVGFFVSIILARILAPEDFGLLAIIMVFIGLAGVFLDFGFSTALVQRSVVTELHYSSVFFMNIIMGLLLGTIVFLLAPFIARFYERDILVNLIRVMSFCFIINAFGNVTRAHLRREMDFKIISYANIASAIISGGIAIYMAYHGYGVWSLVIQAILGQLLSNVFLYVGCKVHFALVFSLKSIKELWGFSSRIFGSGILDALFINFDSLLIGKVLSPATLGYYYRAKSLQSFSTRYTSSTISSVLLPSLSSLQNEPEKHKKAVLKIFHLLSFISFLTCGILLVSSREIIILLFSAKWEPSIVMFQIIIAGTFSNQIFSLFFNVLLSTGNSKLYFKINIINKILLFANFGILFFFDLNVYLIGYVLIMTFIYYLAMVYVSIQLNFRSRLYWYSIRYLLVYGISSLICLVVKYFLPINNLLISLLFITVLFTIIFCTLSHLLIKNGLNIFVDEMRDLINQKKTSSIS